MLGTCLSKVTFPKWGLLILILAYAYPAWHVELAYPNITSNSADFPKMVIIDPHGKVHVQGESLFSGVLALCILLLASVMVPAVQSERTQVGIITGLGMLRARRTLSDIFVLSFSALRLCVVVLILEFCHLWKFLEHWRSSVVMAVIKEPKSKQNWLIKFLGSVHNCSRLYSLVFCLVQFQICQSMWLSFSSLADNLIADTSPSSNNHCYSSLVGNPSVSVCIRFNHTKYLFSFLLLYS